MEQKKSRYLILFPKSAKARIVLGLWWICETILIETPLYYAITTPYEQQILGPINTFYFISSAFAAIYGAICLGLGYWKWSHERPYKKPL
jgi:hypothetical protein